MKLSPQKTRQLRGIGHQLKPVVLIGDKGLSEGVIAELDRALEDHELIKVSLRVGDRDTRKQVAQELCVQTRSTLVQSIGNVVLVYRGAKKPNPALSNVLRFAAK